MFPWTASRQPQINGEMVKVKRAFPLTWISKQYNYGSLHGYELWELPQKKCLLQMWPLAAILGNSIHVCHCFKKNT